MKTKKENLKKFIKEHKLEIALGSIAVFGLLNSIWFAKKAAEVSLKSCNIDRATSESEKSIRELTRVSKKQITRLLVDLEATGWPIQGLRPTTSVSEIEGLSRWGSALRGAGIYTIGELVGFIRTNGFECILEIPGIGDLGYASILGTIKRLSSKLFQRLYV